jgi:phage tail protein X
MKTYYSIKGETLADIAFKHYGKTFGVVEKLMELNPKAIINQKVPEGTPILLPELNPVIVKKPIKVWD